MDYIPLIDTKKLGQPRPRIKVCPWASGLVIAAVVCTVLLIVKLHMRGVLPW